jgi:polar amino acid transport system substrate-binding protein
MITMRAMIASPDIWGIDALLRAISRLFAVSAVFAMMAAAVLPASARAADDNLPLMFDTRERLPRPDLSTLVRLRILTTVDFPPLNFADQTGRLSGFNVDLARDICAELKIETKCQIQPLPYDQLEAALEGGNGEAVMAGIAVTPDLRRRFSFSRPYLGIPGRFVRNLSAKVGNGVAATALAGRPVGVVRDTAHEAMAKAFFPRLSLVPFDSYDAMLDGLKQGKVDAVFADGLRLPFWVASDAAAKCCSLFDGPYQSEKFLGEGLSVMLRKNDPALVSAFDQALSELARNGRLQDLYLRYFPNGLY